MCVLVCVCQYVCVFVCVCKCVCLILFSLHCENLSWNQKVYNAKPLCIYSKYHAERSLCIASVTSSPASTLVYACYVVGTAPPLPDFMASFVVGDCSYLFVIVPSLVRKYTI